MCQQSVCTSAFCSVVCSASKLNWSKLKPYTFYIVGPNFIVTVRKTESIKCNYTTLIPVRRWQKTQKRIEMKRFRYRSAASPVCNKTHSKATINAPLIRERHSALKPRFYRRIMFWLTDWSTHWLTHSLTDWLIDWLIHCVNSGVPMRGLGG